MDYSCEAIDERNPEFELPGDLESTDATGCTMSLADAATWAAMVARRPLLACFRPAA